MASNATTLTDETGAFPDWLELYNPNDAAVDLGGWWMSDNLGFKFRWQFPTPSVVDAGGYLLLFCDNDPEQGPEHTAFSLSAAAGSDVALYGPNVRDNPAVDVVKDLEASTPDVSFARMPDGSAAWEADPTPTPGDPNG